MEKILNFFPDMLRKSIKENLFESVEEIRIRTGKPIILKNYQQERVINYLTTSEGILQILQKICDNSIYSYQNQICNGFITVKGGHRVGLVGSAVIENNRITNIKYISGLNFRIARQVIGCSNEIMKDILNYDENRIYNTLIISPPGLGKTTILRDAIRNISNGINGFRGITVGIVDERGEIAAMHNGIPQNDIGIRTDVMDNVPKYLGLGMLIRSMAPKVIAADEIRRRK